MLVALKVRVALGFFLFFYAHSAGAIGFHQNLYSEHAFLNREELVTSSIRVRGEAEVWNGVSPYFQLGSELSTLSAHYGAVDIFSHLYAAPGLKFQYGQVALFNEMRVRGYYKPQIKNRSIVDVRSLFVYGDFFIFPIVPTSFVFRFAEPYSETLFTSIDRNNVVNASYIRLGLRAVWAPRTFTDLFVEPYVTLDSVRHYYNNRADLKLSFRFIHQMTPLQISLISSVLYNTYFDRGDLERNPYQDKSTGVRFLLVIGGDFL